MTYLAMRDYRFPSFKYELWKYLSSSDILHKKAPKHSIPRIFRYIHPLYLEDSIWWSNYFFYLRWIPSPPSYSLRDYLISAFDKFYGMAVKTHEIFGKSAEEKPEKVAWIVFRRFYVSLNVQKANHSNIYNLQTSVFRKSKRKDFVDFLMQVISVSKLPQRRGSLNRKLFFKRHSNVNHNPRLPEI